MRDCEGTTETHGLVDQDKQSDGSRAGCRRFGPTVRELGIDMLACVS